MDEEQGVSTTDGRPRGGRTDLAVEVEGLVKSFGDTRAVDGIDLVVRAGTVYGVLGPNGAGKTTLLKVLATLLRPDAGSARVLGYDVVRDAADVRARLSMTGQFASVDDELTGRENLVLVARLLGLPRRRAADRAAALLDAFGLVGAADKLGRHAPPTRHRGEHHRHAGGAVPRRTDDGSRSS
jgi:ABC-2 type transport system ATP-binding protein